MPGKEGTDPSPGVSRSLEDSHVAPCFSVAFGRVCAALKARLRQDFGRQAAALQLNLQTSGAPWFCTNP